MRDFLEQPKIWSRITSATKESFNPDISLCRSFVCQLKIIEQKSVDNDLFWDTVLWCIEYAARSQETQLSTHVDLLNEVDLVADYLSKVKSIGRQSLLDRKGVIEEFSVTHWTSTRLNWVHSCTFMHLAAACGLHNYLASKFELGESALLNPKSTPLLNSAISDYDAFVDVENRSLGKQSAPSAQMVKVLLEYGADPNQSFEGLTVFQRASSQYIMERKRSQGPDIAPSELIWLQVLTLLKEHGAEEFDPTFWRVLRTRENRRTDRRQKIRLGEALVAQSSREQSTSRVDGSTQGQFRRLFRKLSQESQPPGPVIQTSEGQESQLLRPPMQRNGVDGLVWRRRTELFPGGSIYHGHIGYELVYEEDERGD